MKVGVVLNPATPLSYIRHYIHLLDKITIMTVDPGLQDSLSLKRCWKNQEAKELKEKHGYKYLIEVDGFAISVHLKITRSRL